jgi:trehalose synthase-fused probable maltokinase
VTAAVSFDAVRATAEAALHAWLPRQRWYGGGLGIRSVHIEELTAVAYGDPLVAVCIVAVEHDDGSVVRYNLPLAVGSPQVMRPSDPGAVVHEDESTLVFDALADTRTADPLWRIIAGRSSMTLNSGRLSVGGGGLDPDAAEISPLVREQSNTSLVVDGNHMLKVIRRVVFEPSLELEMTQALVAAGFDHIAPPEAWLHYHRDGEAHPALLAMAQPFLHNGTEAWTLALTSLRDLYAEAEEHLPGDAADRVQTVEDAGGSFTYDAVRLGEMTARMHLAMAGAVGSDVAPQPITTALLNSWADEMLGDLDALIDSHPGAVPGLSEQRPVLERRISAIRTLTAPGLAIRIHGDYHLGQVLRTDSGWTVLDFEGEPRRSVEHRRRRHSPLRDVAGMLRSFEYAAAVALMERIPLRDPSWAHLAAHGRSWSTANREALWAAYVERTVGSALLPDPGAALTLRRAFEIQKAVYEVGYELAHRPLWVSVPLTFLMEATP